MTAALLRALLPSGIAIAEVRDDPPSDLFPEEEAGVARAVEARRREFATGRLCARRALRALGHDPVPVLAGPPGHRPQWPEGVIGTITHCTGYRAAACGWEVEVAGLGIDAEPNAPLPSGVRYTITVSTERAHLECLARCNNRVSWDRLLFSAKETVYKVWHPLTGDALDFEDACVDLDPHGGFAARLLRPGPVLDGGHVQRLEGRWATDGSVLVTAIALRHALS